MAKISAWMALVAAAAIVVAMARQGAPDFGAVGPVAAAILLYLAAFRTLTAKPGGQRLLAGAWGLTTGLAWYAPSYDFPDFVPGAIAVGSPVLVSVVGFTLLMLHKPAE